MYLMSPLGLDQIKEQTAHQHWEGMAPARGLSQGTQLGMWAVEVGTEHGCPWGLSPSRSRLPGRFAVLGPDLLGPQMMEAASHWRVLALALLPRAKGSRVSSSPHSGETAFQRTLFLRRC